MDSRAFPSGEPSIAAEPNLGQRLYDVAARLYPICRSITGDGVRETLRILGESIDLEIHEVATGTPALDWTIPKEWNIRDAYVKDRTGHRVIDFAKSNLHVLNYSIPVHRIMPLDELKEHIHTLPDQPDVIPYRTSYYSEQWGFCMSHNSFLRMQDGDYEVRIDSRLANGHLTYGEYLHRGETESEVLLSTHVCHPSLANDNCSGLAVLSLLAASLRGRRTRYGYRFLFAPGTIGAITWLARNEEKLHRISHGLIVSCVGDGGGPTYKRSRRGDAAIDRIMEIVVRADGRPGKIVDFSPYGYDERQYCSPGFDLPVGLLQRSPFGAFTQYHTSADDLDFIRPEHLASSFQMIEEMIEILETDWTPVNLSPKGEPQLGRRGLYTAIGGTTSAGETSMAYLWVLNLADGVHSLLDIAHRSGLPYRSIAEAARLLREHGLLSEGREKRS